MLDISVAHVKTSIAEVRNHVGVAIPFHSIPSFHSTVPFRRIKTPSGLRASKERRSHWTRYLTNLEYNIATRCYNVATRWWEQTERRLLVVVVATLLNLQVQLWTEGLSYSVQWWMAGYFDDPSHLAAPGNEGIAHSALSKCLEHLVNLRGSKWFRSTVLTNQITEFVVVIF